MANAADIPPQLQYYNISFPDIQRSVGNRSRYSSCLSGLQHLPSVVERATLIAHADMYYSTPNRQCYCTFMSNIGKGDAYIHIPRTSTVASPLTTCLDLLDSDRPKTRRLKTPFNMSVPVSHLIQICSSAYRIARIGRFALYWIPSSARRGLSFTNRR